MSVNSNLVSTGCITSWLYFYSSPSYYLSTYELINYILYVVHSCLNASTIQLTCQVSGIKIGDTINELQDCFPLEKIDSVLRESGEEEEMAMSTLELGSFSINCLVRFLSLAFFQGWHSLATPNLNVYYPFWCIIITTECAFQLI